MTIRFGKNWRNGSRAGIEKKKRVFTISLTEAVTFGLLGFCLSDFTTSKATVVPKQRLRVVGTAQQPNLMPREWVNERVRQRARKKEKEVYQERTEGEERERKRADGVQSKQLSFIALVVNDLRRCPRLFIELQCLYTRFVTTPLWRS